MGHGERRDGRRRIVEGARPPVRAAWKMRAPSALRIAHPHAGGHGEGHGLPGGTGRRSSDYAPSMPFGFCCAEPRIN